jgi:hypothetical protein
MADTMLLYVGCSTTFSAVRRTRKSQFVENPFGSKHLVQYYNIVYTVFPEELTKIPLPRVVALHA